MPTLHWIGKDKVINHHRDVPFRVLQKQYTFTADGPVPTGEAPMETSKAERGGFEHPDAMTAGQGHAPLSLGEGPGVRGNMIIHGDNLEALKALLPQYEGKVKCIYIDPPYNTGNEGWVYNDNVNDPRIKKWLHQVVGKEGEDLSRHDKWLCMMYPRLVLLHKLLAEDGAIWISIDDNEQANLRLMIDEIIGPGNFIANIVWQKKYTQSNDAKYFSSTHDFIVCYAKSKALFDVNLISRTAEQSSAYRNPDNDRRGPWMSQPIQVKTPSEAYIYEIRTPMGNKFMPPKGRSWQFGIERYNELVADNRIWFGKDGMNVPRIKKFLSEVKEGIVPRTIWLHDEAGHNDAAKRLVKEMLPEAAFDTPKPPSLIERVLQIGSGPDSLILDSFAGSGTTAHAVLNLNKQDGGNRKFILVEMEDYAETITAERVRRVMNGYPSAPLRAANTKKATPGTGGSFSYYTLGPRLFDEHHNLNEEVGLAKIREYVWYTETRTELPASSAGSRGSLRMASATESGDPAGGKKGEAETPYFLGEHEDTAYYFVYEKERLTVLDYDTLALLKTKAGHYVIYADNCVLPQAFLETHGITFKKIPRDITRF